MGANHNQKPKLLFYLAKLIFPKTWQYWIILMYLNYQRISRRKYKYNLVQVPDEFIFYQTQSYNCFKDINNSIIVNPSSTYDCDRLITLFHEPSEKCRIVHVIQSPQCSENDILLSSVLHFNLQNAGIENGVNLMGLTKEQIQFADEIEVSFVKNPWEINNSLTDALLEKYFSTPKIVKQDDMIEINIKHFAEDFYYSHDKLDGIENVYFKCTKLRVGMKESIESCFSIPGKTVIKRMLGIQRLIPKKFKKTTKSTGLSEIPLAPYGLQGLLDMMKKSVNPFLKQKKINLKPVFLVQGPIGSGRELLVTTLASQLGMHFYKVQSTELMASVYVQNETKLKNVLFNARNGAPCVMLITNFENFGKNNENQFDERLITGFADELNVLFENNFRPVLLFCSTSSKTTPFSLKKLFIDTFEVTLNDTDRKENIRWILEDRGLKTDMNLEEIENKTKGLVFEDLRALVYYAEVDARKRNNKGNWLGQDSIDKAIDFMQAIYSEGIGAPKVPKVEWSDVGGMNDVKEEIIKVINLPLKHPELLKKSGLGRSGILLFGPPGTGKTLIAKAVATECSLCFLAVKGPELLNMYVGQSEQNIREVFERARAASPCIIFFDELDSLAPNRGLSGDSGGVMDRVVSQLLAEMNSLSDSGNVFIIGATNRPDLIDPALLRPGRFDKLLYVGPCTDVQSKQSVLTALTRKFKIKEKTNLADVVNSCPEYVTGADFYGMCANAWFSAVKRLVKKVESGELSEHDVSSQDVVVSSNDFSDALKHLTPSISAEDLKYFESLRKELSSYK
ncbi:unnamed protein product [Acanthoscelides obtectus]|uniref:Peroxisomal ATPase PEX6 n=1 Tax=Acanthoscelides obtectus TaxID=200917 RepID=A0A9P0K792_ACAOB|nr:unnamed protein product [Acanthoscelides obtectus]CAK1658241.1 Peroxisome assembly factor 2 [Acanthoscelides obtectus]